MFLNKILLTFFAAAIVSTAMAQTNDYKKNWRKVDSFEKKGLTRSAADEVTAILKMAQKENNEAQQIKASMFLIKYRNMVEDDSYEKNIFYVDTLIAGSKSPAKNILQSMHAGMFWQYVQNNRWKFYNRTKLADEKGNDISTWSIDRVYKKISTLYKASLQNEALLKSTKLDGFDAIIEKGKNTRQLRPTLYDFLAHRALAYFITDETDLTKPAYQFTINSDKAFAPYNEFINASFKTKDTASLHHKAILLLQDILKFHSNDAVPDALIDADMIRVRFINQYAVMENKEKLYETALKNIETRFAANPLCAQAAYLRARIYYDRGGNYEPFGKTDAQYEIKRAKELCETVYNKFPNSEGGINCKNLVIQILSPSFSIETEQVNVPNQPFRSLVTYKNVPQLYLRIIKTNNEEIKKLDRRDYDALWKAYTNLKPLKSWSVVLPSLNDYQQHKTEIKVDGLGNGVYFILSSMDKDFSLAKNVMSIQRIYVSNISYISNNNSNYYVLNRDNGQPLAGAQVQSWEYSYSYDRREYQNIKSDAYTADKNGMFTLKKTTEYKQILLQIKYKDDELFLDNYVYNNTYDTYKEQIKPQTFLFTDRSIYRPGQTIYFKGIVVKRPGKNAKAGVVTGFTTKLILRDANYQKAGEVNVTTNDFGSYKGSFKLPEGGLNGQFSLMDSVTNANFYFSVEEYKRPKFITEIQKPKGTYRINDSITVTGTAKAYAGNNVDGAKVKYRVVRKTRYPIWWEWGWYKRSGYGRNETTEITNGETVTDAKGEFKITFKALPDESADKKSQPIFNYEVSADVTDLNGETRSGETNVAVAYQALQLRIDMPAILPADSLKKLNIRSTNINDIFEKATVNVFIQKVKSPEKIYRERLWEQPDLFTMSQEEYYNNFPYDLYKDEDKMGSWPLGDKVTDVTDTTSDNAKFNIQNTKFESGWYKIVATTKDKYGEEVKAEHFIQLTNPSVAEKIYASVLINATKTTANPGEQVQYSIATGFDKVFLIHTMQGPNEDTPWLISNLYHPGDRPGTDYENFGNAAPLQHSYYIYDTYRGGMAMSYAFVMHNRVYDGNQAFSIPWSNKQLNINFNTFRDKTLPGSAEKYSIKITGNKGEKVAAELLAGMYDASLDQYKPHSWSGLNIWPYLYNTTRWTSYGFDTKESEDYNRREEKYLQLPEKTYDYLAIRNYANDIEPLWWVNPLDYAYNELRDRRGLYYAKPMAAPAMEEKSMADGDVNKALAGRVSGIQIKKEKDGQDFNYFRDDKFEGYKKDNQQTEEPVQIRKNFNETAFFFPDLTTDAEGNVELSFTIPEALTEWKLMLLAHTKDVASGMATKKVITQKPLMVQPNAPRFMREGDKMEFSAKVVNLSDSAVSGNAELQLFDAATNLPVNNLFKNITTTIPFTAAAGQSTAITFPIEIPVNFNSAVTYKIIAKTTGASDGEEMNLPVLTNRMLVTESMPLNMRGNVTTKNFKFEKLLNSLPSGEGWGGAHHAVTVEYTSNPAWYAVQALPYLMEYPYECAEQTFNRYYANALATYIANSMPKIKAVFEKWKNVDSAALLSNLQKNEELKSALLQETPWVLEAQSEAQQKKNIALLFDMVKMSGEMNKAFNKLKEMQSSNGGFVWFKGGPDDRYITQYIITGIGHLRKLNAVTGDNYQKIKSVVDKAVPYLDMMLKKEYDDLLRYKVKLNQNNLSNTAIQYLYMRSFFSEYKIAAANETAVNYYKGQAKKYWLSNGKYMQAMIALALHRDGETAVPKDIIKSLKENAISNEELGMYWKEFSTGGYWWYQAPVESQAMMIEAFTDVDKNAGTIDDLKTWLLKNKQTTNWKTTRATAEACYALLLGGSNWLSEEKEVTVSLGNVTVSSKDDATQAGTGYFKKRIDAEKVKPEMGNINVTVKQAGTSSNTSWGSVYWQYFEDLDKITPAETPLKLKKQLFIERNTDKGPELVAINDNASLNVGDKIKVRIELRVDRDMEYVHMKDMRAACMEPVNVISQYKWQGGLGYYESTKDAATNFFFSWLSRGTYVFEYSLLVTHTGNFSNGITTIQCMYAPEFTSHSEGVRVNVK